MALTLEQIKAELHRLDKNQSEDEETFKASVVLLASLEVGPNVRKLAKFTGYPAQLVAKFSYNLRESKVWRGGRVYANWFEKDGDVALALDSCIAVGWMITSSLGIRKHHKGTP